MICFRRLEGCGYLFALVGFASWFGTLLLVVFGYCLVGCDTLFWYVGGCCIVVLLLLVCCD